MNAARCRRALRVSTALIAVLVLHGRSRAQTAPPFPSEYPQIDRNGVDVTTGQLVLTDTQTTVGRPGEGGLSRVFLGAGLQDNLTGSAITTAFPLQTVVTLGGVAKVFHIVGQNTWMPIVADGSVLTEDGGTGWIYHLPDGTVAYLNAGAAEGPNGFGGPQISLLVRPNGEQLTYHYTSYDPTCVSGCMRLQAVTSNLGYMIKYEYAGDTPATGSRTLTKVTAINLAVDYCNPDGNGCSGLTRIWNAFTFSGPTSGSGVLTATDSLNRSTRYTLTGDKITQIVRPSGITRTIAYDAAGCVQSVSDAAGTWTYHFTLLANGDLQATITDPLQHTTTVVTDGFTQHVKSATDPLGRTTSYAIDSSGRVGQVTFPEGNAIAYQYDARGNVTVATRIAKPGSGLPSHVTTAVYPVSCPDPKTCNRPTSITEGGATTDFTYDPNSGQILTITGPPGASGIRPVTTYRYSAHTASFLDGSGAITPAASSVFKLDQISACATQATCAGTSDEVRTVLDHGSTGPNNLQLASVTNQDGTGALSATTSYTYNIFGDVRTVDGPLPGTGDTVRYRYDTARQLVGFVDVDPDGPDAGQPGLAIQFDWTPDGQQADLKYGTVASQSDTAWLAFSKVKTVAFVYDGAGQVIRRFINTFPSGSAVTQEVTQFGYDAAGQLICSAVRMNPAVFSSLPADPCSLGPQGADGPDRITRSTYDAAGHLTGITSGSGTSVARTQSLDYTANGLVQHLTDGNGNLTTFGYDGFDRLSTTNFPSAANGSVSSTTDFLQELYDPTTGDLVQERIRDGEIVTYHRDARHRVTDTDMPTTTSFTYDNFDRLRSASASGQTVSTTYDALGRVTSSAGVLGSVGYQYDLAGRRTRTTWPDGFFVTYDRDPTGEVTAIREAGATSGPGVLAAFAYDRVNRRVTLTRGNGAVSTYTDDALGRLAALSHDLPGSANDQTINFTYNAADQISSRTLSSGAYGATGFAGRSASFVSNGLNQYGSVSGQTYTYGLIGNLRSDGAFSYTFDRGGRLIAASGASFSYDPVHRLQQVSSSPGGITAFAYDGDDLIAEYDGSGGLQRRYVHGPGLDQPLVSYDASGHRTWLIPDERGSIVAQSDLSGGVSAVNAYDEHGASPSLTGRFGYTGQVWLPEAGVYHDKTRAYSPRIGRFLQPDTIGYAGGANLYAYVGGDPVNLTDPFGRDCSDGGMSPQCLQLNTVSEVIVTGTRTRDVDLSVLKTAGVGPRLDQIGPVTVSELVVTAPRSAKKNCPGQRESGVGTALGTAAELHGDTVDSAADAIGRMKGGELVKLAGDKVFSRVSNALEAGADLSGFVADTRAGVPAWRAGVYHALHWVGSTGGGKLGTALLGGAGFEIAGPLGAFEGAVVGGHYGSKVGGWIGTTIANALLGCH